MLLPLDAVVFLCTLAARVHTAWRQLVLSANAHLSALRRSCSRVTLSYFFARLAPAFTPRGVSLCSQPTHNCKPPERSCSRVTQSYSFARLAPAFAPRGVTLCPLSYRSTTQPSEAAVVMMMTYSYHCTLAPRRSHIAWRPLVLSAIARLSLRKLQF